VGSVSGKNLRFSGTKTVPTKVTAVSFCKPEVGADVYPEVYLNLWNSESLDDDVFDGWLDSINPDAQHVIIEQCYSGGFLAEVIPTTGG
jgi:hypothetical protein